MNVNALLLAVAVLLPGVALAHHHHHHDFDTHHTSDAEWVCVRWEPDVDGDTVFLEDGGVDAGACSCAEQALDADGGTGEMDGGLALEASAHPGEHCAQWRVAAGCSATGGLLPAAAAMVAWALRRRTSR